MKINEVSTINFKSTIFKALADPSRLRILNFLRTGEKCACDIVPTIGFAQPTVSRHLKVLIDCGILTRRKQSNKMIYSVTSKKIYDLIDLMDSRFIEFLSRNIVTNIQRGFR
ncbi:MAG: metalloregulator ArsR/SmtB family transcription factor [Candidatus Bathyarchaeia archaeon]